MESRVVLIDAFGQIFRSYFAFAGKPLTNPQGKNVNALFGFFKTLFQLVREQKPTHLAVVYDSKTDTFRHEMYPQYKAQRDAAPEDLIAQLPDIEEILAALGVPILQLDGYEADDLLATAGTWCREHDVPCFVVSNDKDLLQMVAGSVKALRSDGKGGWRLYDAEMVLADKGVKPDQIVDWLALVGDAADNIPGVPGVGEKTAQKLLAEFGSLDGIYADLGKISSESQRKKLEEGRESAYLSKSLAVLKTDVPCGFSLEGIALNWKKGREAYDLFLKHNAKALATEALDVSGEREKPRHEPGESTGTAASGPRVLEGQYETILTLEQLDSWITKMKQEGAAAIDLETDSLDTFTTRIAGISMSCSQGSAAYLPLIAPDCTCLETETVLARLKPLFEDRLFKIIGQNFKFDWKVLKRHGITVPVLHFDTMIAAWLLDSNASVYNLETLGINYLGLRGIAFDEVVAKGKDFTSVPIEKASRYSAEDADLTWRLYELLGEKLKENGFERLFFGLEMPLCLLLAKMEDEGIALKADELQAFGVELERRIHDVEEEIFALCGGKRFNLGSPKQLQEVLFVDRQLVPPTRAKIKTGFSTDSDILEELSEQDPVPAKILVYRGLTKLKSTYVDTLPVLIHPKTGRVHTQFIQTGTATGRLASKDPNLQNIPIRDEDGRRIRRAFVPREDWVFVSADYSQIELVVLAHLSEDKNLVQAFLDGQDIHRRTAALMFGVMEELVNTDMRRAAKTINFGIMYGMSAFRLANELKISRKEATNFLEAYQREFSGVGKFFEKIIAGAEREGYVTTMMGHRRTLGNILGRNRVEKQAAERVAMNSPIQGSAADIVKTAMLLVDKRLLQEKLQAKLILQVHDELLVEAPRSEEEAVKLLLKEEMEKAVKLKVPLKVGLESGTNWGEFH